MVRVKNSKFFNLIKPNDNETSFSLCKKKNYLTLNVFGLILFADNKNYYVTESVDSNGIEQRDSTSTNANKHNNQPSTLKRPCTMSNREKYETKKSILILTGIFVISLSALFYVYLMFPELEE